MPTIFEHGNTELEKLIKFPTLGNLVAYFNARTAEWIDPIKSMECFSVGVFYDLTQTFKHASAFDLLDAASLMDTREMPDKKFMRYIDLLSDLASATDTTEMPQNLRAKWDEVILRGNEIDPASVGLTSMQSHYRIVG